MHFRFLSVVVLAAALFSSCDENSKTVGSRGPIVLNDSSTIVTETDPRYLEDVVEDIDIRPVVVTADTTARPASDTATAAPAVVQNAPAGEGLKVPFKQVTIFIPNIDTRTYREPDLETASGASYELVSGELQGNTLRVSGAEITEVSQRYQTIVIAKNELGVMVLSTLRELTDWKPIKGENGVYPIKGLEENQLQYEKANAAQIRTAMTKAIRAKRLSRSMENRWLASIKGVRSPKQRPLRIVLRSVMWKIEGKDENGRTFVKQLRVDIPV